MLNSRKYVTNYLNRLKDFAVKYVYLICCCLGGKKVADSSETRLVEVDGIEENSKKKHNKIKTSKYTLLMFLPKNLSEQFRRVANFYFLIVTVIALVIDSPVSPYTNIAPLSFMVMVTAVKQGYEDWLRHKADNVVNNEVVEIVHKGVLKEVRNSSIAPGTLVRVKRGRAVPADLVLLCSANEKGKCYVTTANLDGETNLKTLRVPPPLIGFTPDILPRGMKIDIPHPVADLYTFYGRLEIPGQDSLALNTDNLMLRGSRVKNIEWAIGCAIYTGEETKLALNSKYAGNKFSSSEVAVNTFLAFFILLLVLEILASFFAKVWIEMHHSTRDLYLGPGTHRPVPLGTIIQDLFSFLLIYYYIIPMSLYVTIELYKFLGVRYISWDEDLRCEETGRPAFANTSDLSEELGQVEVLFSDKTGTLTKNLMAFKSCSIKGKIYEERDEKLYDVGRTNQPVNVLQTDIKFFFKILALCHSVQISNEDMKTLSARLSVSGDLQLMNLFRRKIVASAKHAETNGTSNTVALNGIPKMDYQGSSPDEKALVEAAARFGITFLGEDGNNLLLKVGEETEMFERLQFIEFTSERKRMSVIVRDKDGKIWLFCKGAESAIFPICKDSHIIEETDRDINSFATKGLRTLAVAYREVSNDEYYKISEALKRLDGKSIEVLQQVTQQYRILEKQLNLIGATAVEDCLQDDVADTLATLKRAGIKTWVLTGDKIETAINVAQSCSHISENDRRIYLVGIQDKSALKPHLQECIKAVNEPSYRDLNLIVDGTSMSCILDTPNENLFVNISMKCNAVLCCRLSPIQKAKIVKLIKNSPEKPITAAIGDGANDISMIQEAHVGFGIFGKEGHQAARSADFAFTKFSMIKKMLLVLGHWYYQRFTTLILYFFYKNLVLGNVLFFFQINSAFSTQSIFDSMYLTLFNLFFTAAPCLILSVTEQRWKPDLLLKNPTLYRDIKKNSLMSLPQFAAWLLSATYHSVIVYFLTTVAIRYSVIDNDGKTVDLWQFGAILFHLVVLVVNLKLLLHTRYQTFVMMVSVLLSFLLYVVFNLLYSYFYVAIDGDILGTYTRLLCSPSFYFLNVVVIVIALVPDYLVRLASETWASQYINPLLAGKTKIFNTRF